MAHEEREVYWPEKAVFFTDANGTKWVRVSDAEEKIRKLGDELRRWIDKDMTRPVRKGFFKHLLNRA